MHLVHMPYYSVTVGVIMRSYSGGWLYESRRHGGRSGPSAGGFTT